MISDGRSPAYPCPELSIPPPRLEPGSDRFRLRIALGAGGTDAVASSGPGSGYETPPGPFPSVGKRCTMLSGGTWSGTFGRGTIVVRLLLLSLLFPPITYFIPLGGRLSCT